MLEQSKQRLERERMLQDQKRIDAETRLLEQQAQSIELENRRKQAALDGSSTPQGEGPSHLDPAVVAMLERWGRAAAPRRSLYPDFDAVVFAPDVQISPGMIELMSGSEYAADIAYYLGKNKADSARIAALPLLQQAAAIQDIESRVKAGTH